MCGMPADVTIVEVRPPWDGVGEYTRFQIARLRYTSSTSLWAIFWRDRNHRRMYESGYQLLRELLFRVERLGVHTEQRVEIADDPGKAILRELKRQPYQLVVLGAVDRTVDDQLYLGSPIQTVLTRDRTPAVVLVAHE